MRKREGKVMIQGVERSELKYTGWSGWRGVSGVIYDRRISARVKKEVYKIVARPAMMYGLERVKLRKRCEAKIELPG